MQNANRQSMQGARTKKNQLPELPDNKLMEKTSICEFRDYGFSEIDVIFLIHSKNHARKKYGRYRECH